MKSQAQVVIVGGGIMGVSLLYHLTKEGWNDVVLVEKGELTSGSTWHAAGQCPHFVGSYNAAKIHNYSNRLYQDLEKETGQSTGWHGCGSLRLALKEEETLSSRCRNTARRYFSLEKGAKEYSKIYKSFSF